MKTVNDLCKATGVTRKQLRGYNDIGLLCPINSERKQGDNSPWLYEDTALTTLRIILIYIEAGYDRKAIKQIFDSLGPEWSLMDDFENLRSALLEKRKRIDGMINFIDLLLSISQQLPEPILEAVGNEDFSWLSDDDYSKLLYEVVDKLSSCSSDDKDKIERYLPYFYQVVAIDSLRKYTPDSKEVQECVHSFIMNVIKQLDLEKDIGFEDFDSPEEVMQYVAVAGIISALNEIPDDPDAEEVTKIFFKDGKIDFFKQALQHYYDKYKHVEALYELGIEENM